MAFALLFLLLFHNAFAVGVRALDQRAIMIKDPGHFFVIAVARAGNRMVAAGDHGVIVYSDNNGVSWLQASVPVSAELTSLSFSTPLQGWAVGHYGVILHTLDGGATWQTQLTGQQANQITLAAAQAATAANNPAAGTPLALRRAAHFVANGPDVPFLTILASSPSHAVAFGAYRMAMATNDGGKTWTDWTLHVPDPLSQNLYGATAIGGNIFLVGETGLIFRSTDDGASFQQLSTPATATMFGVIATGDGGILAYGVAGEAFRSADSGTTWTAVALGTNVNLTAAAQLTDGKLLISNEYGVLYASHDQGRSFTPMPSGVSMAVFGLAESPDHHVIAVGNAGILRVAPFAPDQG